MSQKLHQQLHDAYGGYSDKRYKKVVFGRPIAVDRHDRDGGGINQSVHALIWVRVYDGDVISISLSGNVPGGTRIDALIRQLSRVQVDGVSVGLLRQLATEARKAPVPSDNKSLYYARGEVAEDLDRLAGHLCRYLGIP